MFLEKLKSFKSRILSVMAVAAIACAGAVGASAAESGASAYADITQKVQTEVTSMITSVQPMLLGILASGLVIFGVFLIFRLGKRAISTATGK